MKGSNIKADIALMETELHLDGMNTHITRRGPRCPLYGTDFHRKIATALAAARRARHYLRAADGFRQRTITTRGSKNNTYKGPDGKILWDAQYRRKHWSCPFCDPNPQSGFRNVGKRIELVAAAPGPVREPDLPAPVAGR